MTAHSKTITNSIRAFGGSPPSLWNAYNWNGFKWAEGTVKVPFRFTHLVPVEPLAPTSARYFRLTKMLGAETITLGSSVNFYLSKLISNTLSPSSDMVHAYLYDSEGYYHNFPGGTTDAEARVSPSWAGGTSTTPTWTLGTASSTVWSQA